MWYVKHRTFLSNVATLNSNVQVKETKREESWGWEESTDGDGGTPTKLLTLFFFVILFITAQNPCNTGIMYFIHNKIKIRKYNKVRRFPPSS